MARFYKTSMFVSPFRVYGNPLKFIPLVVPKIHIFWPYLQEKQAPTPNKETPSERPVFSIFVMSIID